MTSNDGFSFTKFAVEGLVNVEQTAASGQQDVHMVDENADEEEEKKGEPAAAQSQMIDTSVGG